MIDVAEAENIFSDSEDDELAYEPVEFDPETSSVPDQSDEIDSDTLAFRDAVRDIWHAEGRFDLLLP
jgi:hypothetical protein